MADSLFEPTAAYQSASTVNAVFTIKKAPAHGVLFVNTTDANDDTARQISAPGAQGLQFEERSARETFIKASEADAGWEIIVDEGT